MEGIENLRRFLQRREDSGSADDGLEAYAEEICDAVGKIKVVSWEAIHRERFRFFSSDRELMRSDDLPGSHSLRRKRRRHRRRSPMHRTLV